MESKDQTESKETREPDGEGGEEVQTPTRSQGEAALQYLRWLSALNRSGLVSDHNWPLSKEDTNEMRDRARNESCHFIQGVLLALRTFTSVSRSEEMTRRIQSQFDIDAAVAFVVVAIEMLDKAAAEKGERIMTDKPDKSDKTDKPDNDVCTCGLCSPHQAQKKGH